jgi:hypothetical protein
MIRLQMILRDTGGCLPQGIPQINHCSMTDPRHDEFGDTPRYGIPPDSATIRRPSFTHLSIDKRRQRHYQSVS